MSKFEKKNILLKNHKVRKKLTQTLNESLVNSSSLTSYYEPLIQRFFPLWSNKKTRAKIRKIERLSDKVIQITLKPKNRWSGFKPGQFIELTVEQNGALVSRCFTISSAIQLWNHKGLIQLTIREQDHGRITPWLIANLTENQHVQISAAQGEFVIKNNARPKLMIAGGTGITPIHSILASLNYHQGKIDLLYFAPGQHILRKELEQIADSTLKGCLTIHFVDTDRDDLLSEQMLTEKFPDIASREVFLCGPGSMIEEANRLLALLNVPANDITQEYFFPANRMVPGTDIKANVTFKSPGKQLDVQANNEKTLLELAEDSQLAPQYGCRMGICHQCKCNKTKGVVMNTLTGQVSDTGEEEIQLCVSMPMSDLEIEL